MGVGGGGRGLAAGGPPQQQVGEKAVTCTGKGYAELRPGHI